MKKEAILCTGVRPLTAQSESTQAQQVQQQAHLVQQQVQQVRPNSCRAPQQGSSSKRQQQQGIQHQLEQVTSEGGGGSAQAANGQNNQNCRQKYQHRGQQKRQQGCGGRQSGQPLPQVQDGVQQQGRCGVGRGGGYRSNNPKGMEGGGCFAWKGGPAAGATLTTSRQGTGDRKVAGSPTNKRQHNRFTNSAQPEGDRLRSAPAAPNASCPRRPPSYRTNNQDSRHKYYKGGYREPRDGGRRIASATFRPGRCDNKDTFWPGVECCREGAAESANNPNRPLYYSEVAKTPQKDSRKEHQVMGHQGRRHRVTPDGGPPRSSDSRHNPPPFAEIYRFPKRGMLRSADHQERHCGGGGGLPGVVGSNRCKGEPPYRPWSRGAGQTNSAWTELRPYYSVLPSRPRPSPSANWRWATLDRALSPERDNNDKKCPNTDASAPATEDKPSPNQPDKETSWRAPLLAPRAIKDSAATTAREGKEDSLTRICPEQVCGGPTDDLGQTQDSPNDKAGQNKETTKLTTDETEEKMKPDGNRKLTELEKVVKELGISTGVPSCEAVLALKKKNISESMMKIFEESFKAELDQAELDKSRCTNLSEIEALIAAESGDVDYALNMKKLHKGATLPRLMAAHKSSAGSQLDELRNQLKPLKDQEERMEPEVAAAILQALEKDKGLELKSSPQLYFRKLFPSLGDSDIRGKVSSFKGLDKSIVVPMSPDNPNCRWKCTLLEDAAMMDYLKGVAYDRDFPKIQGYYYSVPGSEVLKEAKNPFDVLDKAWRAAHPSGVKTKDGTIVIGT